MGIAYLGGAGPVFPAAGGGFSTYYIMADRNFVQAPHREINYDATCSRAPSFSPQGHSSLDPTRKAGRIKSQLKHRRKHSWLTANVFSFLVEKTTIFSQIKDLNLLIEISISEGWEQRSMLGMTPVGIRGVKNQPTEKQLISPGPA